jgi:hypothetical protein
MMKNKNKNEKIKYEQNQQAGEQNKKLISRLWTGKRKAKEAEVVVAEEEEINK